MNNNVIKSLIFIFFAFPVLCLAFFFKISFEIKFDEIIWVLKNSLIQSFFSALISICLGFIAALGLLRLSDKGKSIFRFLGMVPIFLPSLFIILIAMSLFEKFPFGSVGIVLIMCLINVGFAAVQMSYLIEQRLGRLGFIAEVYGLNKIKFITKIIIPLISKPVLALFTVIFVNVFTSFSIPILVGGGRGTNLEVLIYEKVFIDQNWSLAIFLSILQMSSIFILNSFFKMKNLSPVGHFKSSKLNQSLTGLILFSIYLVLFFAAYLKLFFKSLSLPYMAEIFNANMLSALVTSFIYYAEVSVLFSLILVGVIYLFYHCLEIKFLNFFLNPSPVIISFSLYLLFSGHNRGIDFFKVSLAFVIVSFFSIYKTFFENRFSQFKQQAFVARSFGLSFADFVFKIFLPQNKKTLYNGYSIIFIYCISDFALIKSTGAKIDSLGVLMESYLSSYRIEGAFVISMVILVTWALYSIILGALCGIYKKS